MYLFKNCFLFLLITGSFYYAESNHNPGLYFNMINKAELAICDSNYHDAVIYYKEAIKYLEEPFGNDLNNFLYCGFLTNDKTIIEYCIPKYKERDYKYPYWINIDYKDTGIANYFDSLYTNSNIVSKIDTNYRNFIKELMRDDQAIRKKTGSMDYKKAKKINCKQDSINMRKLKKYIDSTGIFPTEAIVGNSYDNSATRSNLLEILLINYAANVGMDNCFNKPVNLHLDKKVLAGEFPPDLYAHLCDSRGYGIDGKIKPNNIKTYGAVFGITVRRKKNQKFNISDKNTWDQEFGYAQYSGKDLDALNKRRNEMYMEPYEDLVRKIEYQINNEWTRFYMVNRWFLAVSIEREN